MVPGNRRPCPGGQGQRLPVIGSIRSRSKVAESRPAEIHGDLVGQTRLIEPRGQAGGRQVGVVADRRQPLHQPPGAGGGRRVADRRDQLARRNRLPHRRRQQRSDGTAAVEVAQDVQGPPVLQGGDQRLVGGDGEQGIGGQVGLPRARAGDGEDVWPIGRGARHLPGVDFLGAAVHLVFGGIDEAGAVLGFPVLGIHAQAHGPVAAAEGDVDLGVADPGVAVVGDLDHHAAVDPDHAGQHPLAPRLADAVDGAQVDEIALGGQPRRGSRRRQRAHQADQNRDGPGFDRPHPVLPLPCSAPLSAIEKICQD